MSKRTLIRNVHLFDPANGHDGPGGVVLYGDRIVAVFGGDSAIAADADVVIDGQGATLLPGPFGVALLDEVVAIMMKFRFLKE